MGEILEFPEGQDTRARRLEDGFEILATPPLKGEIQPRPNDNPELTSLALPEEERQRLKWKLERINASLLRVLSDNPAETYTSTKDWARTDVTTARLWDLDDALHNLEWIKTKLPQTYHSYATRITEYAKGIREAFADYRTEHADKYRPRNILPVHQKLRKLSPDHFPLDLMDISDQEFERLGDTEISSRDPDEYMTPLARLAEYDPDRFRRVFGPKYPVESLPRLRKAWEDKAAQGYSQDLKYLKDWQTIERVLTETQNS
jgi:hypothetical protein